MASLPFALNRLFSRQKLPGTANQQTRRELLQLAWPIAAAMWGETAMGLVDTKLVGSLGAAALGGVGLAGVLYHLQQALVSGIMRGMKVRVAYARGVQDPNEGLVYLQASLVLALLMGLFVVWLGRHLNPVLVLLHIDHATAACAQEFFAARSWGAPGGFMLLAMVQYRQARGETRSAMVLGFAANLVNAALAYGLIHGVSLGAWSLPTLGVAGAGYATACTELLALCAYGVLYRRDARRLRDRPSQRSLRTALGEVFELGLPTGLQFGFEMLAFVTMTTLLAGIAPHEIAAHQLVLNVMRASFLPGIATAEAASVLIGKALGEGRPAEAQRVLRAALGLAMGFMGVCGLGFVLGGAELAGVFSREPEVIAVAKRLLYIAAIFQVFDGAYIVLRSGLRATKDVRWTAVVGTLIAWVSIAGVTYVLGRRLGFGAAGGWLGFLLETTLGSVLFWFRWKRRFRSLVSAERPHTASAA